MDKIKIANLENDIQEIENIINAKYFFDRQRAENIIRKHNITDKNIALFNSPLNPNSIEICNMTDEQIKNNLFSISMILRKEVLDELTDKRK